MSTARNHMKRSHYSQRGHYMAQMNGYKNRVLATNSNPNLFKRLAGIFKKRENNGD